MKYLPGLSSLQKHIDHYWIIRDAQALFGPVGKVYAYPGIKPEILIILEGHLKYSYLGKYCQTDTSLVASHIDQDFLFDATELGSIIVVQFKPRSVASLQPFVPYSAGEMMKNSICDADIVFGEKFNAFKNRLMALDDAGIVDELDEWFATRLDTHMTGFMTEVFDEVPHGGNLRSVQALTRYSYSTLERHVKSETGLTPKKYLSLRRYKSAVEEIYDTQNPDWMHYIEKYGYYDQSHFIREIKRYTSFTPTQLLQTPGLRSFRPG